MTPKYTALELGAAIALTMLSPHAWSHMANEVVKRRLGLKKVATSESEGKK